MPKHLTVVAVAKLSGVTVRTLHHYDEVGLLRPRRGRQGYRQYSEDDVVRLQQILIYRELGLPLQRIKALMDDEGFDAKAALLEQREQLRARAASTARMLGAIDRALERLQGQADTELSTLFDGFDPARYDAEVHERWGETDAYTASQRRTKDYGDEDWARIQQESAAILSRVAEAVANGLRPESDDGVALAEAYRLHIDRYFYPCSRSMYRGVASLYTTDTRFRDNLDQFGAGTAAFLERAAAANSEC